MKKQIAIFASGSGSNAENIIRYFQHSPQAEIALLVCNRPDAPVLQRVQPFGTPCSLITPSGLQDPDTILPILQNKQIDFIVLAGFLLRIPAFLVEAYPQAIVNIHPALLPKFGGKGMYGINIHRAVLEAGETRSGVTIHYINEHFDEGEHIAQYTCPVLSDDTPESLAGRILELEHRHYPAVIEKLLG
ncbi:MAG: phosphoribosylglycinamide formyltransferase [Coprobacter sp.]|nr:phosphoribosylglycinamide formyltransferase [Coprobacter sp.]